MSTPVKILCFDPANPLLASTESRLDTGEFILPDGAKAGILTIRTASTTQTVILNGSDLRAWADAIATLADNVNGPGTAPALARPTAADVAAVIGNGKPERRR